ncbi:MAG: D-glycerate dehydrogenase [Chloroflexi bacterium]|nr:D-glycerate dehydrogenase [Chloroflexota bacterium]
MVYVTRPIFTEAIELLRQVAEVRVGQGDTPPPYDEVRQQARDTDAVLSLLTERIDAPLLEQCPGLKIVANMAVGVDNINVAAATRLGILVGNTPDVLTETTADLAFALLLAAARRIVEGDRFVRDGKWKTWSPMEFLGTDVWGATLGIVGLGRIGQAVARRGRGFAMQVLYHSRTRKLDVEEALGIRFEPTLTSLLRQSDFVSLHVSLTQETRHLIGRAQLAAMKPTAVLVNTARGPVIDQDALVEALRTEQIAAAGLDVTEPEPIPASHALLQLPNVVVTPHIASASQATRRQMAVIAATNIVEALQGRLPPHCLNPEAFGRRR